ncbi:hypothetical protein QTO34_010877 [Cnephaeus nilssonii]|uniref:Uncharacterized protein n=1 Tax=Cnephaeus nilssonii TaxID=3371016 RepID=A0AA40LFW4_CNENI|nr:hypothetical protein QTO34_010877 [Eptesicus nilssonii]
MEVLKEKVEEEEAAEREDAVERGEKMMKPPPETRKEEAPVTQEVLRDLEKKLSDIEIVIPETP